MQRVATELHAALLRHPEVDLSTCVLRSSWRWTHVRVGPFLLQALRRIAEAVERREVDAVLFSSMVTAALALPLRSRFERQGVRAAAIVHGRDVTLDVAPYQWLVPRIFGALDVVLPVSRATGAACLQRGLAPDRLHVVPNGIDVARFAPLAERSVMRREMLEMLGDPAHPLPEEALLLCSVGRQVRRKGFAWFVEHVMPQLPDGVHYWLAGDGPEGERIRAAADRHGLDPRVRLLGRISDEALARLYRGADLFVMPNIPVPGDMEGFGVVMLEAGLGGLPSVAARLEGITDVITEGANGHLVESGDAAGFARAILPYYNRPDVLADGATRAARHVAGTFSWTAVADRYVRVLSGLR